MFIDYITLMLINLAAGLTLLAAYVYFGLNGKNQKRWVSGFGVVGAIALVTGLHMVFTAFIGLNAYWAHLATFSTWHPMPK